MTGLAILQEAKARGIEQPGQRPGPKHAWQVQLLSMAHLPLHHSPSQGRHFLGPCLLMTKSPLRERAWAVASCCSFLQKIPSLVHCHSGLMTLQGNNWEELCVWKRPCLHKVYRLPGDRSHVLKVVSVFLWLWDCWCSVVSRPCSTHGILPVPSAIASGIFTRVPTASAIL